MRVWKKDEGKWCRYKYGDEVRTGIITEGGQDKDPNDWLYREAWLLDVEDFESVLVFWSDIVALGPKVKPPKF